MRRWIKIVLLITGIAMMAFPLLQLEYGKYQTEHLLKKFENVMLDQQEDYTVSEEEKENTTETSPTLEESLLGVIEIEAIGIRYPIVEGTGTSELKFAIGHVSSTSAIGESGNCVLAGHRGSRYGAYFKRMGELKAGDEIKVTDTEGIEFYYEVTEVFVVEPTETWVLEQDEEDKITLISCESGGKERLVVVGKRRVAFL